LSISGEPKSELDEYDIYSFIPESHGSNLTFYIKNIPSWADFNESSGELSGVAIGEGEYKDILIGVDDGNKKVELGERGQVNAIVQLHSPDPFSTYFFIC